jgi:hypothetical protein
MRRGETDDGEALAGTSLVTGSGGSLLAGYTTQGRFTKQ